MSDKIDYWVYSLAKRTFSSCNIGIDNKEYVLQHTKRGWRCISWHPHYIMTEWVKSKNQALIDGDSAVNEFYNRMKKNRRSISCCL